MFRGYHLFGQLILPKSNSLAHLFSNRSMILDKPVIKKMARKKIPGEIAPQPKKAGQGYIDDLEKKQKFELLDLLQRQEKLLANKYAHLSLVYTIFQMYKRTCTHYFQTIHFKVTGQRCKNSEFQGKNPP